MSEYQFADKDGNVIEVEYDKKGYPSAEEVLRMLKYSFALFPYKTTVEQVEGYEDCYRVSYEDEDKQDIYICAKGTTPGGRSGLKDEQRIQPKAKYLNYVYGKTLEGLKGIFLGIYRYNESIVLCTWRVSKSTAESEETPISKQIKINSIAKAFKDGFAQQERGKGEYACAFRPDFLNFYLSNSDWIHTKPVTELNNMNESDESTVDFVENEYQRAAEYAKEYALENGIEVNEDSDDVRETYTAFQNKFSPDKLRAIADDQILTAMFYSAAKTNDSLCYWLEIDKNCKEYMGSISGGFAYKFGLFQKAETGVWMSGSSAKPEELTEEEAVIKAKEIRDAIVKGADIVNDAKLDSLEDYEKLDDDLNAAMGQYAYRAWIHKYFSMIYPEKLSSYHSDDWQRHVLYAFRIRPSEKYYGRSGQLAMIQRYNNWVYYPLSLVAREAFGYIKKFIRIGSTDKSQSYVELWRKRSIVGVGWKELGSLDEYVSDKFDRSAVADKLAELYYSDDTRNASRKAGEIQTFYNSDENTVFVVMEGQNLISLVDELGPYTYDPSSDMAHIKKGKWHNSFGEGDRLPFKSVGKFTTCYEITDEDNLMYLYEKYFYELDEGNPVDAQEELSPQENEERFIQWYKNLTIPEPDSNAGSHYSEKTIMIDVRHLRRIPLPDGSKSIFLTRDVGIVEKLIANPPQIAEESDAVNGSVPRALKKYRDFLMETNPMANAEDEKTMKTCLEIEREPRKNREIPLNVIIYGAPGTGKTYGTAEYALKITGTQIPDGRKAVMKAYNDLIRKGQVVFTTFHQSYGYEEFIQGLRPDTTSDKMAFKTVDGVFKRIADRALNDDQNNYVIIIDEINRANISKVFGELITLVEDDKRWGEVNETCATLQSGDVFAVPNNLYIVGTMNSADKSISLIDAALRRRFSFIEQRPDADLIADQTLKSVFTKLNLHLTDALGSADLLIGHSYFMGRTAADLPAIFNGNIIPLLYEYFYDNKKSVLKALGDALEGLGIEVVDDKIGRLYVQKKAE